MSSDTVRLRYTGSHPKTFTEHGVGEVAEGDEFDVPEDQAERYTRRADVELAARGKPKPAAEPKAEAAAR